MRFALAPLAALLLAACASDPRPLDADPADDATADAPEVATVDAGGDAGAPDIPAVDRGAPPDAGDDAGLPPPDALDVPAVMDVATDRPDAGAVDVADVVDAGGGLDAPDVGVRLDVVDAGAAPVDTGAEAGGIDAPDVVDVPGVDAVDVVDVGPPDAGAAEDRPDVADVPGVDVADAGPPDVGPPPCVADAIRCTGDTTGVERCVGGAWVLARVCNVTLSGSGSTSACYLGGCVSCRGVDGGASCGSATCAADEDCYRSGWGRCIDGRCARRGILPCAENLGCAPWNVTGVASVCTLDARDLNGDMVRSCTGSLIGPCTANHQCPSGHRCDLRNGRCVTP